MEKAVHPSENNVGNGGIPHLELPCLKDVAPHWHLNWGDQERDLKGEKWFM